MMPSSSRMLCSSSTTRTRVSAMDPREAQGEDAAGAERRFHVDVAAVVLHDPIDEGQTDAGAVGLRGEERLEDVSEVFLRDAFAGVRDTHLEASADGLGRNPQFSAVRHRLHGVEAEIPDRLAELLRVDDPLE